MANQWRQLGSLEAHDSELVQRWNQSVKQHDRVYFLGDFAFMTHDRALNVVAQLKGEIHFIRGNHDKVMDGLKHMFASYQTYKEIKITGQRVILFHFPIVSWHQVGKGSWHLHGHTHGNLPAERVPDAQKLARLDVGVDTHDYRPYHYDEVAAILSRRHGVPKDHHQS